MARGEIALSEIAAKVVPVPVVGTTPVLAFTHADGSAGKLADYHGKYVVVHFWASWCTPCKKQLPALKLLQKKFAKVGLATVSLSLDEDAEAWQTALKRLDLPWRQGRLTAGNVEISSVPAYWLLDAGGKIVAQVNDPDELAKRVAGYALPAD